MVADVRARMFKDRLDGEVTVSSDLARAVLCQRYDLRAGNARGTGRPNVVGHVRLLVTLGLDMVADTFPVLIENDVAPERPFIFESYRLCINMIQIDDFAGSGLRQAILILFATILKWGLANSQQPIVTVTDTSMERILQIF